MVARAITRRLRRQTRLARWLVARHPLGHVAGRGARLLRALENRQREAPTGTRRFVGPRWLPSLAPPPLPARPDAEMAAPGTSTPGGLFPTPERAASADEAELAGVDSLIEEVVDADELPAMAAPAVAPPEGPLVEAAEEHAEARAIEEVEGGGSHERADGEPVPSAREVPAQGIDVERPQRRQPLEREASTGAVAERPLTGDALAPPTRAAPPAAPADQRAGPAATNAFPRSPEGASAPVRSREGEYRTPTSEGMALPGRGEIPGGTGEAPPREPDIPMHTGDRPRPADVTESVRSETAALGGYPSLSAPPHAEAERPHAHAAPPDAGEAMAAAESGAAAPATPRSQDVDDLRADSGVAAPAPVAAAAASAAGIASPAPEADRAQATAVERALVPPSDAERGLPPLELGPSRSSPTEARPAPQQVEASPAAAGEAAATPPLPAASDAERATPSTAEPAGPAALSARQEAAPGAAAPGEPAALPAASADLASAAALERRVPDDRAAATPSHAGAIEPAARQAAPAQAALDSAPAIAPSPGDSLARSTPQVSSDHPAVAGRTDETGMASPSPSIAQPSGLEPPTTLPDVGPAATWAQSEAAPAEPLATGDFAERQSPPDADAPTPGALPTSVARAAGPQPEVPAPATDAETAAGGDGATPVDLDTAREGLPESTPSFERAASFAAEAADASPAEGDAATGRTASRDGDGGARAEEKAAGPAVAMPGADAGSAQTGGEVGGTATSPRPATAQSPTEDSGARREVPPSPLAGHGVNEVRQTRLPPPWPRSMAEGPTPHAPRPRSTGREFEEMRQRVVGQLAQPSREAAGQAPPPVQAGQLASAEPPAAGDTGGASAPEQLDESSPLAWYHKLVRATGGRIQGQPPVGAAARPAPPAASRPVAADRPPVEAPASGGAPASGSRDQGSDAAAPERAPHPGVDARRQSPPPVTAGQEDHPPTPIQPAPLAESTRRFLRPLVGVDPAEVTVVRGPEAQRASAALGADAFAAGDVVALGAGHEADSPETLGLLAHELTHVARARSPRFVPPIARGRVPSPLAPLPSLGEWETSSLPQLLGDESGVSAPRPSDPGGVGHPSTGTGTRAGPSGLDDEEAVARLVERRVATAARRLVEGVAPGDDWASGVGGETDSPHTDRRPAAEGEPLASRPAADAGAWGGLPAPWEPMPAWPAAPSMPAPDAGFFGAVPPPAGAPGAEAAPAPAAAQRAETGRSLPEESDSERAHEQAPAPAPDLDALARQVYDILKRRIAAERRRGL